MSKVVHQKKKPICEYVKFKIRAMFNNTRVDVTDEKGNVLLWKTAGSVGFKNSRKNTPLAACCIASAAVKEAFERGARRGVVEIRGLGVGRDAAIKTVCEGKIRVLSISEIIAVPHNGVRPRKARRV